MLAGIGQRWLEMERAMGIEYIAEARIVSGIQWIASRKKRRV
jgi:hypothetical protein